jgi:hypothetical protein
MAIVYIGSHDLIVDRNRELVGFHGRTGTVRFLTAEEVRQELGYGHLRHIYWLVEQGYLPYRKFGRELVFIEQDIREFQRQRGS